MRPFTITLVCILTSGLGSSALLAATDTHVISAKEFLQVRSPTTEAHPLEKAEYYFVDSAAAMRALSVPRHLQIIDFPAAIGESVTLDLKPGRSAIDQSTICIASSPTGDISVKALEIRVFRGVVLGEPHSKVVLTCANGRLLCSILRESGVTYVFGMEKNSTDPSGHMLVAENDLLSSAPFTPFNCINDDIIQPYAPTPIEDIRHDLKNRTSSSSISSPQSLNALLQTDIAVEADSFFFAAAGGNLQTVLGYIGALFSMSSTIYEDETNITWHLNWIKVWTTTDPYQVKGNAYGLEPLVPAYWKAHYANVQRDLAHVMTSIGYGGGGYGWFSLCDTNWSYSVSSPQTGHTYPTFAFTYDAYIVAHEIGHNFSLPHSHTCYWAPPLDTCYTRGGSSLTLGDACDTFPILPRSSPGTIMSYCANANYTLSGNDFSKYKLEMTFSHRVDTVLRANAEKAACIQPPTISEVILLSPRGSETFPGDTTLALLWTYANVQNVTLDFTSNGGTTWQPIVANVPASIGTYNWKLPNVASQQMLIRIRDAAPSGTAADTSLLFFTVTPTSSVSQSFEDRSAQFSVSTNPAKGFLMLNSTATVGNVECDIIDELGRVVQQSNGVLTAKQSLNFKVAGLPSGKYFLRVYYSRSDGKASEQMISFIREE
jgi:hypothetical protein